MITNNQISQIISKVRSKYSNIDYCRSLLSLPASIYHRENKNTGKIQLEYIEFRYYDAVILYKNKMVYSPQYGGSTVILTYKDWEDLLSILSKD